MKRMASAHVPGTRRGVALLAVVVTLVIVALMMSAIAWQIIASGRMLDHRVYDLQAEWLARAGIERAAARILANPDGYREETLEPMELSSVVIEVTTDPNLADLYRVTCEARYPTDMTAVATRRQTRVFKRLVDGDSVRVECVAIE